MLILKDVYTDKKEYFSTIYQISKYLYDHNITKNKNIRTFLKKALKNGTSVYKHYFIFEEQ